MANFDIGTETGHTNSSIALAIKGVADSGLTDTEIAAKLLESSASAVVGAVYVEDFGGGTDVTNNTTALNDAIDYLYSTFGGGSVVLGAGTYNFSGVVKLRSKCGIAGAGSGITYLKLITGSNANGIELYDTTTYRISLSGLEIQGDYWNGDNKSTTGNGASFYSEYTEFSIFNNGNYKFNDVIFSQWAEDGLSITGTAACVSNYFTDVYSRNNGGNGYDLSACTDAVFIRCIAASNSSNGFYAVTIHSNCKYIACKSFYNGRASENQDAKGFLFNYTESLSFSGCEAQENFGKGFLIQNTERVNGDLVADANGSPTEWQAEGVDLYKCSYVTLNVISTSMHSPTWQGTGIKMYNVSYYNISLMNNDSLVTTAVNDAGGNTDGILTVNGVLQ